MATTQHFPLIEISGNPLERGQSYGRQCATRIRKTVELYRGMYPQSPARLRDLGRAYLDAIREAAPELGAEIRGISESSFVAQEDLALLNARSELMGGMECTSVSFPATGIMGQTWDWARRLEELTVLLRIVKPDGRRVLMLVEPGMVGKIGMNSDGIGSCINFLRSPYPLTPGVPFHVLSRLVLEESSLAGALSCVERHGDHSSGNLTIGSTERRAASIELAGTQRHVYCPHLYGSSDPLVHTNHYIRFKGVEPWLKRIDSSWRFERAYALMDDGNQDMRHLQLILRDRSQPFPILRGYRPTFSEKGMVGTVAVLGMDLPSRTLVVKKGHGKGAFQTIDV